MLHVSLLGVTLVCAACGGGDTGPRDAREAAPGPPQEPRSVILEAGADLLQSKAPVERLSMYLDGFHAAKGNPALQMEAHHFCNQLTEGFTQCVLFDGNTPDARLMGIEYIIGKDLYATLPPEERAYWHPHNYEILSGQLRMPGLPATAEDAALQGQINSYGKTWHTWMTGMWGHSADALPLGPAQLQWSFNRDGEASPGMVGTRDHRMNLITADARRRRQSMTPLAEPQGGVDAMAGQFGPRTSSLPGVDDNGDANAYPVPVLSMRTPQPQNAAR